MKNCLQCHQPLNKNPKEVLVSFAKRRFCNNSHARKWEFSNDPKLRELRQNSLNKIHKQRSAALWKDGKKICSNCREYFPPTNEYFSPQKEMTRQWSSWCKKCKKIQMREKGLHLKRTTNGAWTAQDKREAFFLQKGLCKICERTLVDWQGAQADHDHITNKKRGLLCTHCNHLLGSSFDDINILKKAIEYLQKYSSRLTTIS